VALDLVVDSDQFGGRQAYRVPLMLPLDGSLLKLDPPSVSISMPAHLPPGSHELELRTTDDEGIASVTVWYDGQKVAWRPGTGRKLNLTVPVEVGEGSHQLRVEAIGGDGIAAVSQYAIRGGVVER
jgi:hypothetical protein